MSLTIAALLCFSLHARAEEGCFDSEPVVDRAETWEFTANPRSDFYLPTRNVYGSSPTWAAAHIAWEQNGAISVSFDHQLPAHMVGIQYTVHRLEIQMGNFVYDQDFTFGCTEPGLSFFPRETASIPSIKLPVPMDSANVRIRIWGHL